MKYLAVVFMLAATGLLAGAGEPLSPNTGPVQKESVSEMETITIGGGCFWCVEAVYSELKGVISVEPGYSGGDVANPTYREVCTGDTGHAEVVQVTFDPRVISLKDILEVFFSVHDPTTLNRQGPDVGTQYRSVIFYRDEAQKRTALSVMKEISAENLYSKPLVTQLVPFAAFYKAEDYHKDYYALHGSEPYCQFVISPKMAKFRQKFAARLKPGY
ncbi:MAG: peptide-methionine (S)-S-oxide reductase MsrA [Acidobacteria bacterium]|nr:peptide-methionine (S)-S-oxide reductase MsrA [Acidobacteriota bacterium]